MEPEDKKDNVCNLNSLNIITNLLDNVPYYHETYDFDSYYTYEIEPVELTFDEFYSRFLKGFKKGEEYNIKYTSGNDYFELIFNGFSNRLFIDQNRMKLYSMGIYDDVTKKLNNLVSLCSDKELESEIVSKIESGEIEPTGQVKDIYANHLKKEIKSARLKIAKSLLISSIGPAGLAASGAIIAASSRSALEHGEYAAMLASIIILFSGADILGTIYGLVNKTAYILEGIEDLKREKLKLKFLEQYEQTKRENGRLNNYVLNELNRLLAFTKNLSAEESQKYTESIKILLEEYKVEYKKIIENKQGSELSPLSLNSEKTVQNEFIKKIVNLEYEMALSAKKHQKIQSMEKESMLLEEKINSLDTGNQVMSQGR